MDFNPHERLIEIKQDMPGFNEFIGSWVVQDDLNIVVDVGPASTSSRFIDALETLGLKRVDYVLLTHIHIDHAGGVADLLDHYPMAKVMCHEKAVKYLVDPSSLWAGSLKALGEIARGYGQPVPVPKEKLIPHTKNNLTGLHIIETPGHAAHHLSFSYKKRLFAGEAGGNYFKFGGKEYLRPATPHKFFLDVCLKSVDRLLALEDQPIYYPHFGMAESSHRLLKMSRDQLIQWKEIVYGQLKKGEDNLLERCMGSLLEKDHRLKALADMDADSQKRERFFIANSIKGFIGFLREP